MPFFYLKLICIFVIMKKSDFIIRSNYQNKIDSLQAGTNMSGREYRRWLDKHHRMFYSKNKDIIDINLWNVLDADEKTHLSYTSNKESVIEDLTKKYLSTIRENKLKSLI